MEKEKQDRRHDFESRLDLPAPEFSRISAYFASTILQVVSIAHLRVVRDAFRLPSIQIPAARLFH
jgi:hypothetical protein